MDECMRVVGISWIKGRCASAGLLSTRHVLIPCQSAQQATPAGLEPAILGLEVRRLVRQATAALLRLVVAF